MTVRWPWLTRKEERCELGDCPHCVRCAWWSLPLRASPLLLPGGRWCYTFLLEGAWRAGKGLVITYSHQRWSLLRLWAARKTYVSLAEERHALWLKLFLFLKWRVDILKDRLKQSLLISSGQTDSCDRLHENIGWEIFFTNILLYVII